MTSLIDVVFLLLLFFMLTSTFSRYAQTEITPPASGGGSSQNLAVLAKPLPDGWMINGVPVTNDALAETMTAYREKGAERVILGVEEQLNSQRLVEALETLRNMGLKVAVSR